MMTSEFAVALLMMLPASNISLMNVDTPFCCESPAPTRASTESTMVRRAEVHGTNEPI